MAEAPEEAPAPDHGGLYRKSPGFNPVQALRSAIQSSPWVAIAIGVHVVIFAVFAVVKLGHSKDNKEDTAIITTAIGAKKTIDEPPPEEKPEEIIGSPCPKGDRRLSDRASARG